MCKYIPLGLMVVVMLVSFGFAQDNSNKPIESMEIWELQQELRRVLDEKKAQGCDISEIENLKRLEKKVFSDTNQKEEIHLLKTRLLRQALSAARNICTGQEDVSSNNNTMRPKKLNLSIPGECVQITYAVPESINEKLENGSKAQFHKELKQIVDGRLELILGDEDGPLYVEPCEVSEISGNLTDLTSPANNPFGLVAEIESRMTLRGDLNQLQDMKDIGVKWVRMSGRAGAVWDFIERAPLGQKNYDWTKMDVMVKELSQFGFKILCTINPFHMKDQDIQGKLPRNLSAYVEFLKHLAERYDGDGIDDCPSGATIDCWQVSNEVDIFHFWKGTAYKYARLFKITSDAIKTVSPNVKIALAGASNPGAFYNGNCTYIDILHELQKIGGRFDVLDIHWYKDYRTHPHHVKSSLVSFMGEQLPAVLQKYGFQGVEVWFSEVGTYSGSNVMGRNGLLISHTEEQQAKDLVRRYIHFLSNGVSKVFWLSMYETNGSYMHGSDDYFNNMGLIYNGLGKDDNGMGKKKKSFYAYKLMTQKLKNAQWNRTEKIKTGDDEVFAYKIVRGYPEGPLWVIWTDSRLRPFKDLRSN